MLKTHSISAIIFDMDGVISDTQVIHAHTEAELVGKYGIRLDPDEITQRFAGVSDKQLFSEIFDEAGKTMPPLAELISQKWERMTELAQNNIKEIPGTRNFIEQLTTFGLPLAVGSASRLSFIELVLNELGLQDKFTAIVSAEEVANGKPAPDLFLLAAKRLGVTPSGCLVIEDGRSGMLAAKNAGMQCIGLVGKNASQDYPADLLAHNLSEIDIKQYLNLD